MGKVARTLTIDGETLPIREWSKRSGVSISTIGSRLDRDWEPRDAVFGQKISHGDAGRRGKKTSRWGLFKAPRK